MQQSKPKRTFLKNLLRYFGFPLAAAGVMTLVFLLVQVQIGKEIRKGTYQILMDSARQQSIALERYVDTLATHVQLIADFDASTGVNTLVESLRTELNDEAVEVEVGYATSKGNLLYSDQKQNNVASETWFLESLAGKTVISSDKQNLENGLIDIRLSTRVDTQTGLRGVLFATLGNRNFTSQLKTLAYEGAANTFVSDNKGCILFVEDGMHTVQAGERVKAYINDYALGKEATIDQLKEKLRQEEIVTFRFESSDHVYYAACDFLPAYDWYVFTVVPDHVADVIARKVSMYQIMMLFVILLAGALMATQSYRHERETVQKLEADKDLLRQSAQRYQLITRLSNEVFFQVSLDTGIISFNDTFEAMFGFLPPVSKADRLENSKSLFFEDDHKVFQSLIDQLRAGDAEARAELRMLNHRGIARWKRVEIFAVVDQDKQAVQLVGKIADIQRQKQSMQRLIRQADSDPLTGLLNRGAMERNIKAFLSDEGLGGRHALLMLDFDNFKTINDTFGHAKGDQLLSMFANGTRRLFRSGDFLSRIGGDEYMIFIKHARDDLIVQDKAEALREEMIVLSRKIGIPLSISVGIAVYSRDGETFEKLYLAADKALYQIKRNGKDAIAFASAPREVEEDGMEQQQYEDGDLDTIERSNESLDRQ